MSSFIRRNYIWGFVVIRYLVNLMGLGSLLLWGGYSGHPLRIAGRKYPFVSGLVNLQWSSIGSKAANFCLTRVRTHVCLSGFISLIVVTNSSMTSCKCLFHIKMELGNVVGRARPSPGCNTRVSWGQRNGCSGNGQARGQRTMCWSRDYPMNHVILGIFRSLPCNQVVRVRIGFSRMGRAMLRMRTWTDQCRMDATC
jgi:hypothetical protein